MLQIQTENDTYLNTINTIEDSLVSFYENYLNNVIKGKNQITLREVDCWQGRADLVLAKINGFFSLNIEQAERLSNLTNAQVIALLHYKAPRTLSFLKEKLALTEPTIKSALRALIKSGIIEVSGKEKYVLNSNFILPKIEFNAFEAKLHNWKRALYQAVQYHGFSHYTSVIMPDKYIKPALCNEDFFRANGVGLIGVSNNGEKVVYIEPIKNQPSRKAFYLVGVGKAMQTYLNMM